MKNKKTPRLLLLASCLFLFGAGCPQSTPRLPEEPVTEEKKMEEPPVPDDGLDEALNDLNIVDTESSGGWGAY